MDKEGERDRQTERGMTSEGAIEKERTKERKKVVNVKKERNEKGKTNMRVRRIEYSRKTKLAIGLCRTYPGTVNLDFVRVHGCVSNHNLRLLNSADKTIMSEGE